MGFKKDIDSNLLSKMLNTSLPNIHFFINIWYDSLCYHIEDN